MAATSLQYVRCLTPCCLLLAASCPRRWRVRLDKHYPVICCCHGLGLTQDLLCQSVFVFSSFSLLFSTSLAIRIAEQSAYVIDHVVPSVGPHMWIVAKRLIGSGCCLGWWVGSGLVWAVWGSGVKLHCPIVTNGDFVASLCESAYNDRAVVWRGEWGGPRHSCVRWKSTCLKGKGLFLAWFLAFFENSTVQFTMQTWHTDRWLTRVWKVDNISLRRMYCWILWTIGFLVI